MSGRPPSPSLAPPHSLRTRPFKQGAKNFCCAKLGPYRVFAWLLALGQNLSGFRITRQAKGAGHEQTEVIMSNFELQDKAVKAATRFIERKGFELLETGWTSPEGSQVDLIASDEDALVFIDVTATEYGEGDFEGGKVMSLLVSLEDSFGIAPAADGLGLSLNPKAPHAPKAAMAIKLWTERRAQLENGEINANEFEDWKASL